jgi:hypothetical protein
MKDQGVDLYLKESISGKIVRCYINKEDMFDPEHIE